MDACYKNSCQKMELSYFNDFSNDNLINDEVKDESVSELDTKVRSKDDLIKGLIQNGFIMQLKMLKRFMQLDKLLKKYMNMLKA